MEKPKYNTKIIALVGGPGCGKSRTAAKLFSQMKDMGINVELCTEFAKDLTWEKNWNALGNQLYVTGCQHQREMRMDGQVEYIITDSPLIVGPMYFAGETLRTEYENLVNGLYKSKNIETIFINRTQPYNPVGRSQTEQEAIDIDHKIKNYMDKYDIDYTILEKEDVFKYVKDSIINKN